MMNNHPLSEPRTATSQCLSTDESSAWREALPPSVSVFGSVDFVRLSETTEGGQGRLFVTQNEDGAVAYPFYVRSLSNLPIEWGCPSPVDIASPQYTGPMVVGCGSPDLIAAFRRDFEAYSSSIGNITEFAHLHPWAAQRDALTAEDIHLDRSLVYVDTTLSDADVWSEHFAHSCRKNLRRGMDEGVQIVTARTEEDIRAFHRIYMQTMNRRNALSKYLYPTKYFERIHEMLPNNSRFSLAVYRDTVIAGTLYLYDDQTVYSYLGGADHDFQHLRPTNQIIYDTIQWARAAGRKRLLLGSGYQPNDGIFRFKATFSKLRADFYVYRHVQDSGRYDRACNGRAAEGFFPAYRAPLAVGV